MSAPLTVAERMRARRETWFSAGGFEFLIRRPRPLDLAVAWRDGGQAEVAIQAVVGWRGVKLSDLLPGETSEEVPFDVATWREWCGSHIDVLGAIAEEVARLVESDKRQAEESAKN